MKSALDILLLFVPTVLQWGRILSMTAAGVSLRFLKQ
jgi:hypothetical protein